MERYRRLIIIILAASVALPVVLKSRRSPNSRAVAAFRVVSSARGFVRISGDVRHPGLYPLSAKEMTGDVISMAVPLQPVTVLEPAGIAAIPVINGDALQLHIRGGESASVIRGAIPVPERLIMGIPLDLNTISEADLDKLSGVGPALARRIALYRQKNGGRMSVQDLELVEGIGEKKFAALRNYF